jgi:hypothetical protein
MASASHTWKPICADLPIAPIKIAVLKNDEVSELRVIRSYSKEPVFHQIHNTPNNNKPSLKRFTTTAFNADFEADKRWLQ